MLLQSLTAIILFTQAHGWLDCLSDLFSVFTDLRSHCISEEDCLQKNLVIYERTCLHKCPDIAGYFRPETRQCFKECPIDSVINITTCLEPTYCSDGGRVVFDRRCVDTCPDDAGYQYDHVCYGICPDSRVGNGSRCIPRSDCVKDSKVLNGVCVENCPKDYLLTEDKECVSSCPLGTVGEANLCISDDECVTSRRRVIYDNSCVDSCPTESPLIDEGVCTTQCPFGKFNNGNNCTLDSVCKKQGKVVFNSTCRASCPYYAPVSFDGRCVAECPTDFVANDNVCINNIMCTLKYKVIHDGKCIRSCPESEPFIFSGSCISKCPNVTLIRFDQCIFIEDCISYGRFQYGNKCVKVCPKEASYRMFYSYLYPVCVITCPEETVRDEAERKCLSKTSCFKNNVDAVVFNNTCADLCPSSRKYNYSSVCYTKCPEDTYPEGVQCLPSYRCTSSVRESTRRVFYQGSCLERCPPEARYEHNRKCVSVCPNTTVQLNTFCSPWNCTDNRFFDGSSCVTASTCEDGGKFVYEGECLGYCPYGCFRYTTSCRKLPHMWLSFGITGLLCLLCIIPIVLMLYSPRKTRLCRSRVKQADGQERVQVEYQLVRMVSRADEAIPVEM